MDTSKREEWKPTVREHVLRLTELARQAAIIKHGDLKGGMARWEHHLAEECGEAVAEMRNFDRAALLTELAQVAQLAQTMMEMLLKGQERDMESTWVEPSKR